MVLKNFFQIVFMSFLLINISCNKEKTNDQITVNKSNIIYDLEQFNKIDKITGINYTLALNPANYSCDIGITQSVKFSFSKPTNIVYFTIVSSQNPLYNFSAFLKENDFKSNSIIKFESYVDKTFNSKTFVDQTNNDIKFKERWVLISYLEKDVTQIDINYTYLSERSLMVNNHDKTNFMQLNIFNPYDQLISYDISFQIIGFENLDVTKLRLPSDVSIKMINSNSNINNLNLVSDNYGIQLSTSKNIDSHNQYELFLSLPQQISNCDAAFMEIIFYSMLGISSIFILSTLFTVYYLSKE